MEKDISPTHGDPAGRYLSRIFENETRLLTEKKGSQEQESMVCNDIQQKMVSVGYDDDAATWTLTPFPRFLGFRKREQMPVHRWS
jgi:hypothetical protein